MSKAYLTIDDTSSRITPNIMDYLNQKNITPIMFSVGKHTENYFAEAIYSIRKGAIIGNHSYSHPNFSEISFEACIDEIEKQERILNRLYQEAGIERKYKIFRFPYGDKGGESKEELQKYLKKEHFCRIDDTMINFNWYREYGLNKDIDVFWTFDFGEYQLQYNNGFTYDSILQRIHDKNPKTGGELLNKSASHIILIHDQEKTEEVMPNYYKILLEYIIDMGVEFINPKFIL